VDTIKKKEQTMKSVFTAFLAVILYILPVSFSAMAAGHPPGAGEPLPVFSLTLPEDTVHREYLGLSGDGSFKKDGSFKISQIQAKVVVIEIFSMYCPYCQREASKVNSLYNKLEGNPQSKGKIKLIGIGAGNTPFEVNIFRKKYDIPFPLFSDEDFTIHKCLGEVRTPYFIAVKIHEDGTHKVIYSKLGGLKGIDEFLKSILNLSGLDKEVTK